MREGVAGGAEARGGGRRDAEGRRRVGGVYEAGGDLRGGVDAEREDARGKGREGTAEPVQGDDQDGGSGSG